MVLGFSIHTAYAAQMYIDMPETIPAGSSSVMASIILDPENEKIGAISGTFSFPSDFFEVADILVKDSVVSMWLTPPHISGGTSSDTRTHVSFEGIIPGGFSGVHSPASDRVQPGVVVLIELIPKKEGDVSLLIDDVEIRRSDEEGSLLSDQDYSRSFRVSAQPHAYVTVPSVENSNKAFMILCILSIISVIAALLFRFRTQLSHALLHPRKRT